MHSNGPESKDKSSALIQRLAKGDIDAMEEFYNLYFDRIYSMVFNQVGRNHSSAEDVVQEIWMAVIKSAKNFKGQSQPYTWLCSIAWHKIMDFQRRHYREKARLHQPAPRLDMPELQLIDSAPLPEKMAELEETKKLVRGALSSLPSQYQQVLTLKYLEDMSAKEISQVLNKSTKSVESLLDRARLALRNRIVQMNE
jgi:RNA polymerase sigma-70 factor (ECF subfamily)